MKKNTFSDYQYRIFKESFDKMDLGRLESIRFFVGEHSLANAFDAPMKDKAKVALLTASNYVDSSYGDDLLKMYDKVD